VPRDARIVTPEAVLLDLPTASVGSRVLCRAIDLLVSYGVLTAVIIGGSALAGSGGSVTGVVGAVVILFAIFGFFAGYPIFFETFWGGRTLGKAVMGLRVVRADGGPIGFRHAAVRGALGLIEVFVTLGSLGLFVMLLSGRDQRLGDMAAGTLVLREHRRGALRPVQLLEPPGCEHLVRTMDVGAMSAADYELVRSFLVRWSQFNEQQRAAVAATLAGPLWQRFRHPLPAGLRPDYYLACLGAAYQFRHPLDAGGRLSPYGPGTQQRQGTQQPPDAQWWGSSLQQGSWESGNPQPWASAAGVTAPGDCDGLPAGPVPAGPVPAVQPGAAGLAAAPSVLRGPSPGGAGTEYGTDGWAPPG
jgi:uncharacterized RDD family membrane protein YckC